MIDGLTHVGIIHVKHRSKRKLGGDLQEPRRCGLYYVAE